MQVNHRAAVSTAFFVNGAFIGGWAPLVPVIKESLSITESEIGLMILIGGLSSIGAMAFCSWFISRFGSANVTIAAACFFLPSILALVLAPSFFLACLAFIWLFAAVSTMDVAMNANGAEVEYDQDKPIMSSLHGFWSLGAMIAAALGGVGIATLGKVWMALILTTFCGLLLVLSLPRLRRGKLSVETEQNLERETSTRGLQSFPPRLLAAYLLGLLAFVSFTAEGAVIDWSALYLQSELAASTAFSGFAFASFSLSMTIARFVGDSLKNRIGGVRLMQLSAMVALFGLSIAATAETLPLVMAGFFLAGFGNANIVPLAFSAAANLPGLKPGVGISTATLCGYVGLLAAPASLGYIAEAVGFRPIYLGFALFMIPVFALAYLVRGTRQAQA